MFRAGSQNTRRQFLWQAAGLVPAVSTLSAQEPFDSVQASVWKNARNNGLVMIHRPAPSEITWQAQIVKKGEPGEPLIVAGRVLAPDGTTPAESVTVYAYNTDAQGYYGENRREYPPRIYGWMRTDAGGRFELRTIHPGCYPGMRVPAHVHFVLWGGGYPLQWAEELKFEKGRYITPALLAEDAKLGEFRTIQPLSRGSAGVLRCSVQIPLRRQFPLSTWGIAARRRRGSAATCQGSTRLFAYRACSQFDPGRIGFSGQSFWSGRHPLPTRRGQGRGPREFQADREFHALAPAISHGGVAHQPMARGAEVDAGTNRNGFAALHHGAAGRDVPAGGPGGAGLSAGAQPGDLQNNI